MPYSCEIRVRSLAPIDPVHPEESIKALRKQMPGYAIVAQALFPADEQASASACEIAVVQPENEG